MKNLSSIFNFKNNTIAKFFVLSIFLHVIFFSVKFEQEKKLAENKVLNEINVISPQELQRIKALAQARKNVQLKKQIVNTEKNAENKRPEDSRFLGEKDQSFARQTIGKKIDRFNEGGKGSIDGGQIEKEANKPSKTNSKNEVNLSELGKVAATNKYKSTVDDQTEVGQKKLGQNTGPAKGRGVSSNNDFVDDVPLGDVTHLNTVEYKYFGFYNRIREQLEQYWGNSLREKAKTIYDKGRSLAQNENYITSVRLIIDGRGQIVKISVTGASGVQELDDAAIEAFNKAGPFPNPPSGLLENGKATIEWGFVVRS